MPPRKQRKPPRDESEQLARLPGFPGGTIPLDGAPQSPTEERRERELEELLDALGTDGRIRVWHVTEGKAAYAGDMSLDGFSLETLLDTFGGGEKSLAFYQGKTRVETQRVFLDPSISPRNPKAKGAPVGAVSSPVSDMSALMSTMMQQGLSSMQMMQTIMAASSAQNAQMIQAMVSMMTARPERNALDDFTKMAAVLRPGGNETDSDKLFSILERGMNIGSKLNGGGNDEDGTLGVIKEGLGVVAKIVENNGRAAAFGARHTSARAIGSGAEGGTGGAGTGRGEADLSRAGAERGREGVGALGDPGRDDLAPVGSTVTDRPWVKAARPSMALLSLAIGNVAPETAAQVIADRLEDDAFEDLIRDIETDVDAPTEFMGRFEGYFGLRFQTEETRAWFLLCMAALRAMMGEGGEGDEPTPGE